MGSQGTRYWIGRLEVGTLRLVPTREHIVIASLSLVPSLKLARHRFLPDQRAARVIASSLEQDQFTSALAAALEHTRQRGRATHALLVVELDGVTRVQTSFGPAVADRLLLAIDQRIGECLGSDDRMTRVGLDRFYVLVRSDADAAGALRVADLLLDVVTAPYALEDRQVVISADIGVVRLQSMHDVTGMHEASTRQLWLDAELRIAIDRKEFRMHYQPILSCRTGEVASIEALIRWEHPTRGCLPPAEFLEALGRGDLMAEVGRWTVVEVARQAAEWRRDLGIAAPMAINVSPRQLSDPTFLAFVLDTLAAWDLSPADVTFELTEEIERGSGEAALQAMREMRAAGLRVCIDAVGTRYSLPSYLRELPIDAIKIDREFLRDIDVDRQRRAIVGATIRLAHELDLEVVAEGVETRGQLETLWSLGCDQVQGHFFAHPVAAAPMCAWLSQLR